MKKTLIRTVLAFMLFGFACAFGVEALTIRFKQDFSPAVYDKDGRLLDARVSPQEQWHFASTTPLADTYLQSVLVYEDKNFFLHKGIDPIAVLRALFQNISSGAVQSGASTLTMQCVRISEEKAPRTIPQKIKEMFLAGILELRYSKKEILALYATHAPFGGNTVGLEAASHRYFWHSPNNLSAAEFATLAVLPNQPSLVRPDSNSEQLRNKRNQLLLALKNYGFIDQSTYQLALAESLPQKPRAIEHFAPHYLNYCLSQKPAYPSHIMSDIDLQLQNRCTAVLEQHSAELAKKQIYNAATLIIENHSGKILAYVGNTGLNRAQAHNPHVDIIQALRSSGSLLKPFLYAAALDAGLILPDMLIEDIPLRIGSYIPQNHTHAFMGAVAASEALSKSLNIPFIHLLQELSIPAFLNLLPACGLTSFKRSAEEYGLPLILGGGELSLFEVVNAYRLMMLNAEKKLPATEAQNYPLSSAACAITLNVLSQGERPLAEAAWHFYAKRNKIAWKTGTSFGNRDAWTIGTSANYSIGVWVGNASGKGRPEIVSSSTAAPILFELFSLVPTGAWHFHNSAETDHIEVCAKSGYPASVFCTDKRISPKPHHAPLSGMCPFCRAVALSPNAKYRVHANDIKTFPQIQHRFVLPPRLEYYYKQHHPNYRSLPPYPPSAQNVASDFAIILPQANAQIIIPIELGGTPGAMIAEAVHRNPSAIIYWDLDGHYLGKTTAPHQWLINADIGSHTLTLSDMHGIRHSRKFTILKKE